MQREGKLNKGVEKDNLFESWNLQSAYLYNDMEFDTINKQVFAMLLPPSCFHTITFEFKAPRSNG